LLLAVANSRAVTKTYEIGPFRLDAEAGIVSRAGEPTPLGPRAVGVLNTLVERANEYVPKAAILDAAWPGVVVEEANLAVQISALRRVLATTPGGERWIETLPKRGYRFAGPVARVDEAVPIATPGGSNLSEPLSSFVGREREIVELRDLLAHARLLTLVGIGGIGKTRLALRLACELRHAYRDGVWFVDLAPVADPERVASAVAHVLDVRESVGKPLIDTLCRYVKGRRALLVLDNCEHLLERCAWVAETMLSGSAETTVLATSREPLRIAGEQLYAVHALSLPDPEAEPEAVARSEAVRLFVDRAQRQQQDFTLIAARTRTVADLCVRLDGIPLALELAAARMRALSVEQILARIDDRFRLLTSGSRSAPPRHQTLRAMLDWSYDLLAEDERAVLRRLAICPGSFSLEAASAIASDHALDACGAVDVVSQLVSRSLVAADTSASEARYRLLETTRAYAFEKLAESGEADNARRRHARYFCGLFERTLANWMRMPDARWRGTYASEIEHVRVALDWALGPDGEPETAVALAGASGPVWAFLSLVPEGLRRLEAAAKSCEYASTANQARLWHWLGQIRFEAAAADSVTAFERAIELYRVVGDTLGVAHALVDVSRELTIHGRYEDAAAALAGALPTLEAAGVPKLLAYYHSNLGLLELKKGDAASARTHYERAASIHRALGAERAALRALSTVADATWALGDLDAAVVMLRETAAKYREAHDKRNLARTLANLAGVLTELGDIDAALATLSEGLPLLRVQGYAWYFFDHVALRSALAGRIATAARLTAFVDATYAAKQTTREPNEARVRERLHAMLRAKLAPAELQRLLAQGATLDEDEACRMALEA
jgi:predicted ATPase/DNA-binding winged helix-turn-helix (wHTH) protein